MRCESDGSFSFSLSDAPVGSSANLVKSHFRKRRMAVNRQQWKLPVAHAYSASTGSRSGIDRVQTEHRIIRMPEGVDMNAYFGLDCDFSVTARG